MEFGKAFGGCIIDLKEKSYSNIRVWVLLLNFGVDGLRNNIARESFFGRDLC